MKYKIYTISIILFVIFCLGCVSENGNGKWINATVYSKSVQPGGNNLPLHITQFKDSLGNNLISKEYEDTILVKKAISIYKETQINKTYLIHTDNSGNVDDIILN